MAASGTKRTARKFSRKQTSGHPWLSAGVVTLGVGAALAMSPGVALADPADGSASSPSAGANRSDSAAGANRSDAGQAGKRTRGPAAKPDGGVKPGADSSAAEPRVPVSLPSQSRTKNAPTHRTPQQDAGPDSGVGAAAAAAARGDVTNAVRAADPVVVAQVPEPAPLTRPAAVDAPVAGPAAVVVEAAQPVPETVLAVTRDMPVAALPAPAKPVTVSSFLTAALGGVADGATSGPLAPISLPLEWAALAVSRRQPLSAQSTIAPPAAATTSSDTGSPYRASTSTVIDGITIDTDMVLSNGVLIGGISAQDEGATLSIENLGGDRGGKANVFSVLDSGVNLFTALPYASWLDAPAGEKGTENFKFRIRETTVFDAFVNRIPVLNLITAPLIKKLQDTPFLTDILAPIIGRSIVVAVTADLDALAPGDTPFSYTYKVTSFDGVKISTNFFPASRLEAGQVAPTVIVAPGFGGPGNTNPFAVFELKNEVPGPGTMRGEGYNVVTFDPRGEFASEGVMHFANPDFEGKDTSAIVSWVAAKTPAALDGVGDPKIGMVGGSYGGSLQLAAAGDPRIDALVPVDSWSTLLDTFYPTKTFKTGYGALYMLNLLLSGVRAEPQLYVAVATGLLFDWLGPNSVKLMNASNPPLDKLTAPTLLVRGTEDVLVPLNQGNAIAEDILATGTPLKLFWFNGGHGAVGLLPDDQSNRLVRDTINWLNTYVKGSGTAESIPNFQWYDQGGSYHASADMPFQTGFNDLPDVKVTSKGGLLGIIPLLGGSGPGVGTFPVSIVNGSKASNTVTVAIPDELLPVGTQVVGSPTVSFTYQGLGTARAVYAQVVDKTTGEVLGHVVTPIPVSLFGFPKKVTVQLSDIAYTAKPGDELEVQITSSATAFEKGDIGLVNISDVTITLPHRTVVLPG